MILHNTYVAEFYVLLTVHPCIILWIKQTWSTVFLSMFISFLYMFRATMCPSSGEITVSMRHVVFVTVCVDDCLVCRVHTRQSTTQSDKYQVSQSYSYFSRWWAHSRPKHVEKRNKHSKKNCWSSWLYSQELRSHFTREYRLMHGVKESSLESRVKFRQFFAE